MQPATARMAQDVHAAGLGRMWASIYSLQQASCVKQSVSWGNSGACWPAEVQGLIAASHAKEAAIRANQATCEIIFLGP